MKTAPHFVRVHQFTLRLLRTKTFTDVRDAYETAKKIVQL